MTLRCYIDDSESASATEPAVCVAGYIAQGKKWERFAVDWNKALDRAPKRVEVFHATDYEGERKTKHGNFRGWHEDQREAFVDSLTQVIRTFKLTAIATTAHRSSYKKILRGNRGAMHGSLHLILAKAAMIEVASWAFENGWKFAPSFFVESGSKHNDQLLEAHRQLKKQPDYKEFYSQSAFAEVPKSRQYPQTQPADMLAFYTTQCVSRLEDYNPSVESKESYYAKVNSVMPTGLDRLVGPKDSIKYHTAQSLDELLGKKPGWL